MAAAARPDLARFGTGPVSTEPYISPEYFALEREKIFRRVWLFGLRAEEIPQVGDFVVKNFDICDASVLFVRGKDQKVRAFHNVCSHRQAKLVWDERGRQSSFACRYHGWGYNLSGELRSVPDKASFFDLDVNACGLTPIHLDTWNGFVFINFSVHPEQSLAEYIAPIAARLNEHSFADRTSCVVMTAEIDVNWKAMLDNFQETYHLAFIHRFSVGDRAVAADNPFGHPLDFEFFGPHHVMSIWGNPAHEPAPIESLAARFGGVSGAGAMQQTERYRKIRDPNWQLDVHGIFPNLLIEVAPTFFYAIELIPVSPTRTRWISHHYLPRAENACQRFSQEYNMAAFRDTVAEDLAVLGTLQASMRSGAKRTIHFQSHEILCRHSYNTVERYVRAE
jgi:phenylpropionate dioxygenase-like ring-hydroxylating dioxygenase large terminal subunit